VVIFRSIFQPVRGLERRTGAPARNSLQRRAKYLVRFSYSELLIANGAGVLLKQGQIQMFSLIRRPANVPYASFAHDSPPRFVPSGRSPYRAAVDIAAPTLKALAKILNCYNISAPVPQKTE
jgi:hypothetical protein